MRKLFDSDSPLMRGVTMLANFFVLNLLWLFSSLPIVTMGAAICALYDAMFRLIKNGDDTVWRPFWRAFKSNFKQATVVWIPLLLLMALTVIDWMFLVIHNEGVYLLLWIPLVIMLAVIASVLSHYFAMAARYQMTVSHMLKSSMAFGVLHPIRTLIVFTISLLPVIFFFVMPYLFYACGFFFVTIWFPVAAYINTKFLLKTFSQYSEEERTC